MVFLAKQRNSLSTTPLQSKTPKKVSQAIFINKYNYLYESIPIDPKVFIHPFDRVLGLVTFQLS